MSYVSKSLADGETIKHVFKLHWFVWAFVCFVWILCVSLTLSSFYMGGGLLNLLWIVLASFVHLHYYNIECAVTTKRVIFKKGIISRKTEEQLLKKVETVSVKQGVIGRILGFGTVQVTGTGSNSVSLPKIDDPLNVKKSIEELL